MLFLGRKDTGKDALPYLAACFAVSWVWSSVLLGFSFLYILQPGASVYLLVICLMDLGWVFSVTTSTVDQRECVRERGRGILGWVIGVWGQEG